MDHTETVHSITLDSVIRQSDDQVAADMEGEVALMSIENGKYYCLNPTSSRIWQLIDEPRPVGDVCAALKQEYDIEPEQCETEVLAHVGELVAENLVEVVHVAA